MFDFLKFSGDLRNDSGNTNGDTPSMDGFGISREGNRGIARWRHRDLISKKGVKGFGWILEIWEIKGVSDWFGLLRLSQTILENILCNQDLRERRSTIKGEERRDFISSLYNKAISFPLYSFWLNSL